MATKKKTKKRPVKSKKTTSKKATKKVKRPKPAKKKPAAKRLTKKAAKKPVRRRGSRRAESPSSIGQPDLRTGGQAGDLQGLSDVESADSESVDELLEEGNAFEADVVSGVERAGDLDEREVHTHEVPEDDVPEEYLDEQ
jgi:hypothetical protein